MGQYAATFILVFLAVVLAILITGTITAKKIHFGIPDQ